MNSIEATLRAIFTAALRAVDPFEAVLREADRVRTRYAAGGCTRLLVLGFGKAAVPMAAAVETSLADLAPEGIVITKEGFGQTGRLRRIEVREASHPIPDSRGVAATEELARLAGEADERTLTLVLISGGGSALLVSPAAGITLEDKRTATSLLLHAGADIRELNAVRKHLSRVKGGRLAALLYPSPAISLILSDVLGDRLDVIASGPTAPDSSTFAGARAIIERYGLTGTIPHSVLARLRDGARGAVPETPAAQSRIFASGETAIIGSLDMAIRAAVREARRRGLRTIHVSEPTIGEARVAGVALARTSLSLKTSGRNDLPLCLVAGGETVVTVRGKGRGGRNQELAMAFAREIAGVGGITLLSAGTDGNDGPTDAAGAIVDGMTVARGNSGGGDAAQALLDNDSWTFLRRAGGLLVTGPTGTNVMDLQVILIT